MCAYYELICYYDLRQLLAENLTNTYLTLLGLSVIISCVLEQVDVSVVLVVVVVVVLVAAVAVVRRCVCLLVRHV